MTVLTHDAVAAALVAADDRLIADILATDASLEEFARARAWLESDEALANAGEAPPSGRVAQVMTLIAAADSAGRQEDREV